VDVSGRTALHYACWNEGESLSAEDLSVVRYLVETVGLSVHTQTEHGSTPLHLAARVTERNTDLIRYLVESQEADLHATDEEGRTPLYVAFNHHGRKHNAKYILSKMESIDAKVLSVAWDFGTPWRFIQSAGKKYASGQNHASGQSQSEQLTTSPIHTLMNYPLPSTEAFKECIEHFPLSSLSMLDNHGRIPIHVLLASSNPRLNAPSMVVRLLELEPRSALARDPSTGLHPYEAAALLVGTNPQEYNTNSEGLSAVYKLFRGDPAHFIRARRLVGCGIGCGEASSCREEIPKNGSVAVASSISPGRSHGSDDPPSKKQKIDE